MIILHTPGGMVLAASQIAHALHKHPAKTVAVVPHYAMSGGTLIAIAADEIWMDPAAALGPLDPQIPVEVQHLPAPTLVKVAKEKGKETTDKFLAYADIAERALKEMRDTVFKFLKDKMDEERATRAVEELVMGKYTHDYPLFYEKIKELGLPVKDNVPPEVYELMELYPQAQAQRPGVEYLPYYNVPRNSQPH
jgi:ClpP class serine protease